MGEILLVVVPIGVAVTVFAAGRRRVTDKALSAWSKRFWVALDASTSELVRDRLAAARKLRSAALGIGILIGGLPAYASAIRPSLAADLATPVVQLAWIVIAAFAALAVEVIVKQDPRGMASLEPREPSDYLPAWPAHSVRIAVLLATAGILSLSFVDVGDPRPAPFGFAASVAAVVILTIGLRTLTDRPALALDGSVQAADLALRADGAHHIAGAAVALAFNGAALALEPTLNSTNVWFSVVAYVVALNAVGAWWLLARVRPWTRSVRTP